MEEALLTVADKQIAHDGDKLIIDIGKNLEKVPAELSPHIILKVPEPLRSVNVKAYEPEMIAIGPFTYDLRSKNHLKLMEDHKKRYLKKLLERRGEACATSLVTAMRRSEDNARSCYAESVSLSSDEFVEVMLLDACFIVELFRNEALERWDSDDPIFRITWIHSKLVRDLMLADNQLPFFVLQEFYDMTKTPDPKEASKNFPEIIWDFFNCVFRQEAPSGGVPNTDDEIKHLLGFIHKYFSVWVPRPIIKQAKNWVFIRCATELQEAGIKFEKMDTAPSLFYIEFDKGIMKIPELIIEDDTESLFRNLIVYEQYQNPSHSRFINYMNFMDCLINTANDVKILCERNIFANYLGDEKVVAQMFNRLGDFVELPEFNYYGDIFEKVNEYCGKGWHKWMANLRHKYFNTPWAIISFLAALLLIILTIAQTVFSVLAYFQ